MLVANNTFFDLNLAEVEAVACYSIYKDRIPYEPDCVCSIYGIDTTP